MSPDTAFELAPIEEVLGHRFGARDLLRQALTHKSHAHEARGEASFHNESLEFLGDAVLGFVVTDVIYRRFADLNEGYKSKIRARLVSSNTLAVLARRLDLGRHLRLGKGEEKTGGREKDALGANAFEAVVAAIYLDAGIEAARRFLLPLLEPLLDKVERSLDVIEDPKTALQEFLQSRERPAARYVVIGETGPEHQKTFHVELFIDKRKFAAARGRTKKKAELQAALDALKTLRTEEKSTPATAQDATECGS